MHPTASTSLNLAFTLIPMLVAGVALKHRTLAAGAWMALWALLALSGVLARGALPVIIPASLLAGLAVGLSSWGGRLARETPLWLLVGFQGFRLPLELAMHRAAEEGVMPREMSFAGYNLDILSGASALLVGALLYRGAPSALAWAWNVLGSTLLAVIVGIAVACSPLVQAFGPGRHVNDFVAYFPFVWLPTVLVASALAGHLMLWRQLLRR